MEINNEVEIDEVKKLTMGERIKYFFTNPNKLFEEYEIRPTWLVKLLIIYYTVEEPYLWTTGGYDYTANTGYA
jgi:hypothetical protein